MDYFVDRCINLGELYRLHGPNSRAIRQWLICMGLVFADANQFALFACYGFHGPTEKQTLSMANKARLSILDEYPTGRTGRPQAWNRS